MTLNLQIVLAIMGVIVVTMVYLISRWQNRMRRPYQRSPGFGAEDFPADRESDEDIIVRGGDRPGARAEIPALETPLYADRDRHGGDVPDDPGPRMEVMTAQSDGDVAEDDDRQGNGPATPSPADDLIIRPDRHHRAAEQAEDARTPVFAPASGKPSEKETDQFRGRPAEGFVRLSQIDYWVKIIGQRDVGRETVLAIYRNGAAELGKMHGIHGFKTPEQEWCNVEDQAEDARFADLVVTIQLADHNGAISEQEMARFSALVSLLSEGTGRESVFMAPVKSAFAQADALADFTRHFDSVFTVNIRPQGVERFHGPVIDRYAPQMGLERDANHHYSRFKSVAKGKVALYSLANLSDNGRFDFENMNAFSTHGLTFFTKPAVNRSPGAVFAEMVDTAKAFASRLKGEVNSPNQDNLSQEEVEATRRSIERVAAEMERLGIPAGSDEAARLF